MFLQRTRTFVLHLVVASFFFVPIIRAVVSTSKADLIAVAPTINSDANQQRKNVLLIILDDFRAAIGSIDSRAFTPNLDRLVQKSYIFENAFAQVRDYFNARSICRYFKKIIW